MNAPTYLWGLRSRLHLFFLRVFKASSLQAVRLHWTCMGACGQGTAAHELAGEDGACKGSWHRAAPTARMGVTGSNC